MKFIVIILSLFLSFSSAFSQTGPTLDHTEKFPSTIFGEKEIVTVDPEIFVPDTSLVMTRGSDTGTRMVFWVHGLGGDAGSWSKAADAMANKIHNSHGFSARVVESHLLDYSGTPSSMTLCADQIRNQIDIVAATRPSHYASSHNNFIIAHSQGGIVSRTLLWDDFCEDPVPAVHRNYGGLLTFGTPHQGAELINNQAMVLDKGYDACKRLANAELSRSRLIRMLGLEYNTYTTKVCDVVAKNVIPGLFSEKLSPMTKDFAVGSPWLDITASCDKDTIPQIAFYGIDNQRDLLWTTMSYAAKNPNDTAHWSANWDDHLLKTFVHPMYDHFAAERADAKAVVDRLARMGMPCDAAKWVWTLPLCTAFDSRYWKFYRTMREQEEALGWFRRANNQWLTAIGALEVEITKENYCRCRPIASSSYVDYPIPLWPYTDCRKKYFPTPCFPHYVYHVKETRKDSDGVVLAASAANMPSGTIAGQMMRDYDGVTHMKMRNHSTTAKALTEVLDGDLIPYFKTKKKS